MGRTDKTSCCIKFFAVCLIFIAAYSSPAHASDELKDSDVTQFIATMETTQALMKAAGPAGAAEQMASFAEGKVIPFTISYEKMKDSGKAEELAQIIKAQGFSSPEEWAAIGDRITLAYLGIKMESRLDDIDSLRNMPESMKSEIPPATLKIIEATMKVADAARALPKNDTDAVRAHVNELEAEIKKAGVKLPN